MTPEEKQLLLIDLCARLPYGVMVLSPWEKDGPDKLTEINTWSNRQIRVFENHFNIEEVKPYLRPMSSMTGSERIIYEELSLYYEEFGEYVPTLETFDWLNAHHFDYRGLIPMGLALEAPAGMYKF